MMSAAEISRQLRDAENYPKSFDQSQASIKFEYNFNKLFYCSLQIIDFLPQVLRMVMVFTSLAKHRIP